MKLKTKLRYLEDRWDEKVARSLDEPELLRYRSNLLGSDLRITNFGGGNTSSKLMQTDPLSGKKGEVLWIKGSGGDLGSIKLTGLAALYSEKLRGLESIYRGAEYEDEMVEMYPLCAFGKSSVAASIDTPLHGFLPYPHIDHLHPDWGIALAASANGREKLGEFNRLFERHLAWVPWQRPGFELAMMMRRAVQESPNCDGVVLGGHGLFTWGDSNQECYENTISIVDQLGQFVMDHVETKGAGLFGGARFEALQNRRDLAVDIFPFLRGRVSSLRRLIGNFSDPPEVLRFVNSHEAEQLAHLGTSCPDHFIRTKVRPLFVPCQPGASALGLREQIDSALLNYRKEYAEYYHSFAQPDSPAMRDENPTVVLIPGVGMFSFGKSKTEARLTGEFYVNAIHVMEGATSLGTGKAPEVLPQAGPAAPTSAFTVHSNYVALPPSEAFRIEYWQLEEAKIRRQPPEKELSRQVVLIVGGGSGIGREAALLAAGRGAHVVIADRDSEAAKKVAEEAKTIAGQEGSVAVSVDIRRRDVIRQSLRDLVAVYGGLDVLINTAALFPSSPDGNISDEQWGVTLDVNVTANYLLADEAARILRDQNLDASIVLTSSANAVVAKRGTEAYDVSKAALSHLVRELAISLAPKIRVNGISPATVIKGSTMFPRDRVMASLKKYQIPYEESASDEQLRSLLAEFYAKRTLTHRPIDPKDCAEAILFLAGPKSPCTTGHIIPVDGGLNEAFLR
ncbi:MAG TPA: bifunctional rhamnulose-1-phosphate aldolase/short-chain dehydrogenase [Terriglobales bacterium]|jgi:rhamnose utilization protein RhaD (predicted bifunctional aldolase and dehydrogenase)/NAD(P)-dependent dehydrogenase (short-subunit alcohol dehydrogenase family)|nr:bifunctional rhamnulose-1-phosphate aldolase/short-chain dehydrogenase [Terriglobales bacterium]